ncbi:MAG: non-canonical purine NTP pyrophosphatase [Halobacteriovoraceae bacterium]|nr:non-canonical purine NTP pyrophosphatase [Halobacteriovoraceae bacterium]|tara:strand:- start:528 stop:1118 length:591 start_codon:yes stop_codon:yes gene_type:complete
MKKDIYLASANLHKAAEMQQLFESSTYNITVAPSKIEVVEDGATFTENALKKAKAYSIRFGGPALSDDSGLCVEYLPEKLGVQTAYYGGDGLSDRQRWELLLRELEGLDDEKRRAYFCCVLCFYFSEDEYFFFEGRLQGSIAKEGKGVGQGFGYDPVFLPEGLKGKSLSEDISWKLENSHRSKAFDSANKFFKNYR